MESDPICIKVLHAKHPLIRKQDIVKEKQEVKASQVHKPSFLRSIKEKYCTRGGFALSRIHSLVPNTKVAEKNGKRVTDRRRRRRRRRRRKRRRRKTYGEKDNRR